MGVNSGGSASISDNWGSLSGGTGVVNNGYLSIGAASTGTYSGAISGSGVLHASASAGQALTLSGNNTYTGGTVLDSGSVVMGSNAALGATSGVLSGTGSLDLNSHSLTVGALYMGAGGTITDNSAGVGTTTLTVTFGTSGDPMQSPIQDGATKKLALAVSGTGTQYFMNNCSYTGGTTIGSGSTLWVGYGGTAGHITGNVTNSGTLYFAPVTTDTYSGVISGTGSVHIYGNWGSGAKTETFSGANTYTGGTYVDCGYLTVTGSLADASGTISSGTVLTDSGSLTVPAGKTLTNNGALSVGTGKTLTDNGTITNNGTLASGPTGFTVSSGKVLNNYGTMTGGIANSGTVSFLASTTYVGTISGTGAIVVNPGAGNTVIFEGNQTLSGTTTISSGTLQLGDHTTGHNSMITGAIVDNAILKYYEYGAGTYTPAGNLTGNGAVNIAGDGTIAYLGKHTGFAGTHSGTMTW